MIVRIEDLRDGRVEMVFEYRKPMWVKLDFCDFALQISEAQALPWWA